MKLNARDRGVLSYFEADSRRHTINDVRMGAGDEKKHGNHRARKLIEMGLMRKAARNLVLLRLFLIAFLRLLINRSTLNPAC